VLEWSKGNKRTACRALDISYHTLQRVCVLVGDEGVDVAAAWAECDPSRRTTLRAR
jgi:hypothetical protein